MRWLHLCTLLSILGAATASAQSRPSPRAGDWVRVSTRALNRSPDWMVGSLATVTNRFVVIEQIGAGPLAIPYLALTRVEVQAGWGRRTRRGIFIGGAAGTLAALFLYAVTDGEPASLAALAAGVGLGAAMGHRTNSLRWERVEPAQLKPHHVALQTAVRIGSITF